MDSRRWVDSPQLQETLPVTVPGYHSSEQLPGHLPLNTQSSFVFAPIPDNWDMHTRLDCYSCSWYASINRFLSHSSFLRSELAPLFSLKRVGSIILIETSRPFLRFLRSNVSPSHFSKRTNRQRKEPHHQLGNGIVSFVLSFRYTATPLNSRLGKSAFV